MTPEQREELKPCPFCGGAAKIIKENLDERFGYANLIKIQCSTCGVALSAKGDTSKPGYADNSTTEARALAAWSRRSQVEALTVPQWQSIETAPQDGTEVLAWSKTGKTWHQVYWKTQENGDWLFLPPFPPRWACRWNEAYYQGQAEFSHWTPIPAAPTIPAIPGTKEGA